MTVDTAYLVAENRLLKMGGTMRGAAAREQLLLELAAEALHAPTEAAWGSRQGDIRPERDIRGIEHTCQ
jgi:hypothetical protein